MKEEFNFFNKHCSFIFIDSIIKEEMIDILGSNDIKLLYTYLDADLVFTSGKKECRVILDDVGSVMKLRKFLMKSDYFDNKIKLMAFTKKNDSTIYNEFGDNKFTWGENSPEFKKSLKLTVTGEEYNRILIKGQLELESDLLQVI